MNVKHDRMRQILQDVAAQFIANEAGPQSLITVTGAALSDDGSRGEIFMTVFPDSAEAAALQFANRNRKEFGDFFQSRVRGMRVPRIKFVIDKGEKNRQRLDELSQ